MKETKAPKPIKSTLSPKKTDSLVIDFESMMVPASILLAGLMISLSIIFTFRGSSGLTNLTNKGTGTDTTNTDTKDPTTDSNANDGKIAQVSFDDDPYKGDKNKAKVAVVEFSDYECPFCKRHFTDVYPEIVKKYVDTGKIVYYFRDLPLSFHEPAATLDALSAQCVFAQGGNDAYFKFHDAIFGATESNGTNMTTAILKNLAKKQSGIDASKFNTCLDGKTFADEVKKDASDAGSINIQGTPGFVIGKISDDGKSIVDGTFLGGAYPLENFVTTIDSYLK